MDSRAPSIGVLDSGIGGLSVLREIHHLLPQYPTLYVADQAHLPYGPRPASQILDFSLAIIRFLLEQGAVMVVLACHAASAAALQAAREQFSGVPFVGIEPAVKPAALATRSGVIGVLTTQATAEGALYRNALARYGTQVRVLTRVAPELVTLAEADTVNRPQARQIVRQHVEPLLDAGADHLVLACTHFPFLAPIIQEIAGPQVRLVDPGPAVARQAARVWPGGSASGRGLHRYFTSGAPAAFERALERLLGVRARAEMVRWRDEGGHRLALAG